MNRKFVVRILSFVVVISLWEYFGRRINPILFTYPSAIARAFVCLVASGELWSYMSSSLLVLTYASLCVDRGRRPVWGRHGPLLGRRVGGRHLYQRALFDAHGGGRAVNRLMVWL